MNILLLLLIIQGVILSLLLFTRKINVLQNRLLGGFVLIISIVYLIEVLEFSYPQMSMGAWFFPFACLKLLEPVFLFSYSKALSDSNRSVSVKKFLPALIVGTVFGIWCYWDAGMISFESFTTSLYSNVLSGLNVLFWGIYLPSSYRLIRNACDGGNITPIYRSLFQILFIIILVALGLEILDDVNDRFQFWGDLDFFDLIDVLFLGMIYFISYKALSEPQLFHDVQALLPKAEPPVKYSGSTLSDERLQTIQEQFEILIQKEKPYLNGELTIQDLANQLKVSRQYLTQILNVRMKCNFNDYINRLRVEEFKRRAQDSRYDNYTILALALDSGFNSKTTFNTIFKKHTGQTPSQYRKGLVSKSEE
ncbi:MAG: helix-turn-helix domain-containing protein [Marinifilaceae bacterium]